MFVASAAVTMSRAKNTAAAGDILKCLKTEVSCLDPEVYNQVDHDSLCESYEMFLHAMFRCTARGFWEICTDQDWPGSEATQGSLNTFFFGWVLGTDTWLTCYMVYGLKYKVINI